MTDRRRPLANSLARALLASAAAFFSFSAVPQNAMAATAGIEAVGGGFLRAADLQITHPGAPQRRHFSIFRGPPEGPPARHRRQFEAGITDLFPGPLNSRPNPALTQRVRPGLGVPPVWVTPGEGWLCVYSRTGAGHDGKSSCATTDAAIRKGIALIQKGPSSSTWMTAGLVPNAISAVSINKTNGLTARTAVRENTFADFGRGIRRLIPSHGDAHSSG